MTKKLFILALSLMLIFSSVSGFAAYELLPLGDGSFKLIGSKSADKDTTIIVTDSAATRLLGVAQIPTGEGQFTQIFNLGIPDGQIYTVKINGSEVYYVENILSFETIIQKLNEASASALPALIRSYSHIFDLDMATVDALYDQTPVFDAFEADRPFVDSAAVKSSFNTALSDEVTLEKNTALALVASGDAAGALQKYIALFAVDRVAYDALSSKNVVHAALNGNTYTEPEFKLAFADALILGAIAEASGAQFKSLIAEHQSKIGITAADYPDAVYAKVDTGSYSSFAALQTAFKKELSLHKLNSATKDTIKAVLEAEEANLGILAADGYSSLSEDKKLAACQALVGGNFATIEAARAEFEAILSKGINQPTYTPPAPDRTPGGNVSFSGSQTTVGTQPAQPSAGTLPFDDITPSHWGYASIAALYNAGIMSGTTATSAEPDANVTREQFVKLLVMTLGIYNPNAECSFTDIESGHWSAPYIASAFDAGLTLGNGDGTFGLGSLITRQDMAVMAYRGTQIASITLGTSQSAIFADEADFASYATQSIYALSGAGVLNGVSEGIFAPYTSCTRAMAAKVCNTLLTLGKGGAL